MVNLDATQQTYEYIAFLKMGNEEVTEVAGLYKNEELAMDDLSASSDLVYLLKYRSTERVKKLVKDAPYFRTWVREINGVKKIKVDFGSYEDFIHIFYMEDVNKAQEEGTFSCLI